MSKPSDLGALCHRCTLNGQHTPVMAEWHGSRTTILSTHPDTDEVAAGRPEVGPGGMELNRQMRAIGVTRGQVNITHLLCCQPPAKSLDAAIRAVRKANIAKGITDARDMTLENRDYTPTPIECCRPRLLNELRAVDNVIALGKRAAQAVIPGLTAGILSVRGTLSPVVHPSRPGTKLRVFPMVTPVFVLRQPRWRHVFAQDLSRGWRWFTGRLAWQEPGITYQPTADQLRAFLFGSARFHAYDVETDGVQSLECGLRCLAFATCDTAMVVPLLSVDGRSTFYSHAADKRVREVMREWFADGARRKVGHNAGVFDRIVVEQHFGVTPAALLDSLITHKAASPEMPHNLAFVGSFYTDVHAWKADKTATEAETDMALWRYNALDAVVNARVMAPMVEAIMRTGQAVGPVGQDDDELLAHRNRSAVDRDHAMQVVAVGMKRQGMLIDQPRRAEWDTRIRSALSKWHAAVIGLLPQTGNALAAVRDSFDYSDQVEDMRERSFDGADTHGYLTRMEANSLGIDVSVYNPGSTQQVSAVLFGLWDLPEPLDLKPKDLYTKSGARSTSSSVMQAYMVDRRLTRQQRAFCHAVLMFRKQKKLLGTYIVPMRYEPGATKPVCRVLSDGRVHASWNILPIPGRFNSSGPNVQNWPSRYANANMKELVIPQAGCVFVGADVDQFHLRLIANMWGVQSLLDCFANGWDPHGVSAETFMGQTFRDADGYMGFGVRCRKKTKADQMRDVAKRLRYAGAYGATPETIFRVLRSAMDENGQLINPSLTLAMVYLMVENWMNAEPEWTHAWAGVQQEWTDRGGVNGGYLESPLLRRRRPCLDGNPNDMNNWPILSGEGDIMGDMTCAFVAQVPFGYAGAGTGLINQCHDSLTAEVPEADAPRVSEIMLDCMNRQYDGWSVPITSDVATGARWSEV